MNENPQVDNNLNTTFHLLFSNVLNTTVLNLTSGNKEQYKRAEEIMRFYVLYLLTMSEDRLLILKNLGINTKHNVQNELINKINNMSDKQLFLFFCKLLSDAGIKPIYQKPNLNQQSFFSKIQKQYIFLSEKGAKNE